mmetsp:Transcript_31401/g.100104  ORF Transcript_31401/g.100104 Transcript_31401/m.100104 type:complete len:221 (-) Transcript_31401:443-1105(-)
MRVTSIVALRGALNRTCRNISCNLWEHIVTWSTLRIQPAAWLFGIFVVAASSRADLLGLLLLLLTPEFRPGRLAAVATSSPGSPRASACRSWVASAFHCCRVRRPRPHRRWPQSRVEAGRRPETSAWREDAGGLSQRPPQRTARHAAPSRAQRPWPRFPGRGPHAPGPEQSPAAPRTAPPPRSRPRRSPQASSSAFRCCFRPPLVRCPPPSSSRACRRRR